MKFTEVKYTRRFNVAQFEHAEYAVSAVLGDDNGQTMAHAVKAISELIQTVAAAHGGSDGGQLQQVTVTAEVEKAPAKHTRAKTEKPAPVEDEEVEEDVVNEEETEAEEDDEEEVEEAPKKKSLKKKGSAYDRSNELHKKMLSGVLGGIKKDWREIPDYAERAKTISKGLHGKDFLDADGQIVPEVLKKIKKDFTLK